MQPSPVEPLADLGHRAFALVNLNEDCRLVVGGCGEDLALLGGDGRVTVYDLGHDTTGGSVRIWTVSMSK